VHTSAKADRTLHPLVNSRHQASGNALFCVGEWRRLVITDENKRVRTADALFQNV